MATIKDIKDLTGSPIPEGFAELLHKQLADLSPIYRQVFGNSPTDGSDPVYVWDSSQGTMDRIKKQETPEEAYDRAMRGI